MHFINILNTRYSFLNILYSLSQSANSQLFTELEESLPFPTARNWTIRWTISIQSTILRLVSLKFPLLLSSQIRPSLPDGFPTKIYTFFNTHTKATFSVQPILLDLMILDTNRILWGIGSPYYKVRPCVNLSVLSLSVSLCGRRFSLSTLFSSTFSQSSVCRFEASTLKDI
jgi:hypothetical protein